MSYCNGFSSAWTTTRISCRSVCWIPKANNFSIALGCRNDWVQRQIADAVAPLGVVKAARRLQPAAARRIWPRSWWLTPAGTGTWPIRSTWRGIKQSPDKSDYSDGRLIADLTRVGYPSRAWLAVAPTMPRSSTVGQPSSESGGPSSRAVKLRVEARWCWRASRRSASLLRFRAGAARGCFGPKPRRNSANRPDGSSTICWRNWSYLDKKVLAIDAPCVRSATAIRLIDKLMNQPGIGEVTAWVLRACIGRFDQLCQRQATGSLLRTGAPATPPAASGRPTRD